MIPSAVMTEDQVKTRFKKMFDKKSKGETPHNAPAAACGSRNSDEADMPSLDRRQSVPVVNYSTYQEEIRSRLLKKSKRLRQPSDMMAADEARSPLPRNPVNNIPFHGKQNWSSHQAASPSLFSRLDWGSGGVETRLKDEISTAEAASGSDHWGNYTPTFMRPTAKFDLHSFNPFTNRNPFEKIRNEAPMPNDMMKSLEYFHSQQSSESAMPQHPSLSSYLMNRYGMDSALESQQQLWMNQQTSDLFDKMREAELHQKAMVRKHSFEGYNPECFIQKSLENSDDKVPNGGYNYNSYTAPKDSLPTVKKECFTIDHSPKKRQLRSYEQSKSTETVLQDEDDDLHGSLNSVKRRMTESTTEEHDREMANVVGNQTEPVAVESIKQEEGNKQMAEDELKSEDYNSRVEQNKLIKEESSSDNNSEGESFGSSWETSSDNSFSNGMDSIDSDTSFQSETTTSNNSLAEKFWAKIGSVKHNETYEMDLKKAYYKQMSDHNELQKTLKLACMQTYFDPKAVEAITTFHKRTTSLKPPLSQTHFVSIMLSLSKRFSHFALLQRQFGNLTKKDQRFILSRNCGR